MSNSFPEDKESSEGESVKNHPFDALTPSFVLNAVDQHDYVSEGRILELNSYENRVY